MGTDQASVLSLQSATRSGLNSNQLRQGSAIDPLGRAKTDSRSDCAGEDVHTTGLVWQFRQAKKRAVRYRRGRPGP